MEINKNRASKLNNSIDNLNNESEISDFYVVINQVESMKNTIVTLKEVANNDIKMKILNSKFEKIRTRYKLKVVTM